jgi:hypothetical protein
MLKPTARQLWRAPDEVQLGADPARAVVLRGVEDAHARLLAALDGSHDRAALCAMANAAGLDAAEVDGLLGELAAAGVLDDAASATGLADHRDLRSLLPWERLQLGGDLAAWSQHGGDSAPAQRARRRRAATVRVAGADRVGAQVCTLLGSAGVGALDVVDDAVTAPTDLAPGGLPPNALDQPRTIAIADRLAQTAPSLRSPDPRPAVCVLVGRPAFSVAPDLMRDGIAHLLVDVRPGSTLVGPLVLPGRSACLSCVDRFRTDRDPGWPLVMAQLSAPHPIVVDLISATVAAALAAMQVLMFLDGEPATTVDAVIDVSLPDATTTWRSIGLHPACGCNWSAPGSNR